METETMETTMSMVSTTEGVSAAGGISIVGIAILGTLGGLLFICCFASAIKAIRDRHAVKKRRRINREKRRNEQRENFEEKKSETNGEKNYKTGNGIIKCTDQQNGRISGSVPNGPENGKCNTNGLTSSDDAPGTNGHPLNGTGCNGHADLKTEEPNGVVDEGAVITGQVNAAYSTSAALENDWIP